MSQLIQKFEPGGKTTQPTLYNRGNEQINLDEFANEATIELQRRLANSRLKDKQKDEVRQEFSYILQGMYDRTFQYRLGGGYTNSVGVTNKKKGFDAAGIAAGILGDTLRNQSAYVAPEEKPDPSKIAWSGNSSIGTAITRRLFGSDTTNARDFIGLDYDSTSKKVNGNTKRSQRFAEALTYVKNNFDNLFTSFSPSDKTTALENIDNVLRDVLNDSRLTDNEYLDLGRATGMTNLRDLFGDTYELPTQGSGTGGTGGSGGGGGATDEETWLASNYPRLNTQVATPLSIYEPTKYGSWSRTALDNHLKKLYSSEPQTLFDLINYGLSKNVQLYKNSKIVSYAGAGNNPVPFTNKYIIGRILEILRLNGALDQYADSTGNQFYIKGSYNKNRETGLVWDMGNKTINEVNIYDIPWFVNYMHQRYTSRTPSNKRGGVLRRFQPGGSIQRNILTMNPNRNNIYFTGDWSGYDNWHAKNIVLPWLNSYENADQADWEDVIKKGLDSWNTAGGFDWYNATDDQRKHGMQSAATQTHQQYVIDNLPGLNTEISRQTASYNVPASANTNDRFINGSLKGTDTDFGIQTGNRRPSIHINTTGQDLTDWENFYRSLGYVGKYQYLDHWVPTKSADTEGVVLFGEENQDEEGQEDTPVEPEEHSAAWKKVFETGSDVLGERFLPENTFKTGGFRDFLYDLTPDIVGSGRLWASLHTNNRVYDTVRPSLKPVLKDTYERYSPVTGAFSEMQLRNRQGADVLRQANQPFTSDASLASARMLEGQRQANQLQAEGFLADDKEIRRTQAEALARQEDNMARRSEVANFNRASINQTNRELAQLEATRLKSNQQSWDNFLSGIESRVRSRIDKNRERANNFYDKLATSQAEDWYNEVMEPADRAYTAWQKKHEGADPATEWDGGRSWKDYVRHKREARARANAMIYADMARRYGLRYNNPYTDESNALFNWNRRYIPRGTGV